MNLLDVKITNLFGLFDYKIKLNQEEKLTIITGPNGYGKTTVLNIIYNLFNKRFSYFQNLIFKEIKIQFEDDLQLIITKEDIVHNAKDFFEIEKKLPKVSFRILGLKNSKKNGGITFEFRPEKDERFFREIRKNIPVRQIDTDNWLDLRTDEIVSADEMYNLFNIGKSSHDNGFIELSKILESLNVYLIKEQRLIKQTKNSNKIRLEREFSYTNTIQEYAKELSEMIRSKQSEALQITQERDSTFPQRLLTSNDTFTEEEFNNRFEALIKKQEKLNQYGLSTTSIQGVTNYDPQNVKVLTVYLKDSEMKAQVFDDLLNKIALFTNILNEKRFTHKHIKIDGNNGFTFFSATGTELKLTDLSSGEQHEVVLLYELLFRTAPNTLVLIDEPEISLHVVWQKAFITDLLEITKMQNIQVVVATHSPQIIDDRWDLAIDLYNLSKESQA